MRDTYHNMTHINYMGPIHIVALVNIGIFALLSIQSGKFDPKAIFLGGAMALLAYIISFILIHLKMGDNYIYAIVSMLVSIGLMMQYRLSPATGFKQFVWFLVGTAVFIVMYVFYAKMNEKFRNIWFFYGLMVALFLITIGFGTVLKGARNWIVVGGMNFQPSEFIKIFFVFFMAIYTTDPEVLRIKFRHKVYSPRLVLMVMVFGLFGLFAVQKEYGTALLIFLIYISFIYVFEHSVFFAFANILLAGLGGAVATHFVHHLQVRFTTWINPWPDIAGKGYQITQSLFAIGTGSFFGTGIGLGHPDYIPAVHTDFIFAAICEEMGIFGGIAVILLFFLLAYRGIKIGLRLKDRYSKAVAFGLTIMLGYQTFIIVGGVIKLIPLTGITLPFISYGGSSLISSYVALGILQALSGQILRKEAIAVETAENDNDE